MVIVLDAQAAETPVGKPVAVPIPEAPVVAIVIAVNALLMHNEGDEEAAAAVLAGFTVTVAVDEFAAVQAPLVINAL